jgi:TPR repeat protein
MKIAIGLIALLIAGTACADELADAGKLIEAKAYPQAFALYTRLAQGGDAQAQFRLGEMYWYGETGKVDLPAAETWFKKAAAAGNREAGAALATLGARAAHAADIAYWTDKVDGAELAGSSCAQPAIPALSRDKEEIAKADADFAAWQACYGGAVAKLKEALPLSSRIPADIARLMNQAEYEQALARLDRVYASAAAQMGKQAESVLAQRKAWFEATAEYVAGLAKVNKYEHELASVRQDEAKRNFNANILAVAPIVASSAGTDKHH